MPYSSFSAIVPSYCNSSSSNNSSRVSVSSSSLDFRFSSCSSTNCFSQPIQLPIRRSPEYRSHRYMQNIATMRSPTHPSIAGKSRVLYLVTEQFTHRCSSSDTNEKSTFDDDDNSPTIATTLAALPIHNSRLPIGHISTCTLFVVQTIQRSTASIWKKSSNLPKPSNCVDWRWA